MLRSVKFLTLLLLASCSASPTHHELSRLAASANRLSGEVVPISYKLALRIESDFATTNTYSGTATIVLNVISDNTTSFQFHAKELEFTSLSLTKGSEAINVAASEADPETDLVTVEPETYLANGTDYTLTIEFSGTLSETSMVGFYKSTYIDDYKQTKYVLATQFEETHARKAFPCFDEPEMKATFTLSITYPKGYHAWSNANGGSPKKDTDTSLETVSFSKTPIMSTYLLAFMVAEFNCKTGDPFNTKITVQLCSRINAADKSAKTALDTAPQILKIMSDFTSYNYSNINKLVLASIPDFSPGAMENWALVNFREEDLLWYEDESSNSFKQKVVTVVTHELSHQWFGDLVTLEWWNEMFLNEGFATYFEYHASDVVQPDWQLTKQFVVEQLQSALDADSYVTALPLSYDSSDADYSLRTNDVSYNKGGSILRMVHHFLSLDYFKLGLVDYINNNLLSTVTSDILWSSLQTQVINLPSKEQPPQDLSTIMENWTKQPGYPLLTVTASGNDVVISQEQFVVTGNAENTQWYVPITYTTSVSATEFEKTSTKAWLSPNQNLTLSEVLNGVNWIVLNNQQVGYYRVNYDETLLGKISSILNSNLDDIDEISRAHIVDDQLNLAKAGKKSYSSVLDFLTFLQKDTSYYSWYSAFNGFKYLLTRTADNDVRTGLKSFIKTQMAELYGSVPIDQENADDHLYTLKQVLALTWACNLGDSDCTSAARNKFLDYKDSSENKPSPNLRSIVYCNGLRESDSFTEDFRFLWNKYLETEIATERVTILKALGCVKDSATREMYLNLALTETEIRLQDARYVFQSVYSNNPEGVTDVFNFVIDNYQKINEHFGDTSTVSSLIQTVGGLLVTQTQIDKLKTFSATDGLDDAIKNAATSAVTTAVQNLEITTKLEESFKGYFSNGAAIGSNTFINVFCILVGYVVFKFY